MRDGIGEKSVVAYAMFKIFLADKRLCKSLVPQSFGDFERF